MIYCIGDSFTQGAELPDMVGTNNCSVYAWPSLLEQKLNKPVTNLGHGGTGSKRIIKRAIDCTFNQAELVIVAWSNPVRIELCDYNGPYNIWPGCAIKYEGSRWEIIKSVTASWHPTSDLWAYRNWLRDIILLQTFFDAHNQKYIMLQSHASQHLNKKYLNANKNLSKHVNTTYFLGWPYETMQEWTLGTPRGDGGHFLHEGHQRVAEKINEHIRNLGWIS